MPGPTKLDHHQHRRRRRTTHTTDDDDHNNSTFGSDRDSISSLAGHDAGPDPQSLAPFASPRSSDDDEALDPRNPRGGLKRRPVSLDLNRHRSAGDVSVLSPRFLVGVGGGMKDVSAASSRSRSGTFPSPGTPNYRHGGGVGVCQKGWSSERVPLPANSSRRYGGSAALLPFGNGRGLPSKWEDAEKWILSPVSGDGGLRSSLPPSHLRRPKSKSGPLGAPMGTRFSSAAASPLVPCFDSGRVNFAVSSPFLAGVLMPDRGCCVNGSIGRGVAGGGGGGGDSGGRRSYSGNGEPYIVRSASVHGWSDMLIESPGSLRSSQEEVLDSTKEIATAITPVVLKKDMATQMSPDGSTQSSPKERLSLSPSSQSVHPTTEFESHFSKLEIRDVQVDDRVTVTRWSKKQIARSSDRRSTNIIQWKKRPVEGRSCAWEVAETAKCMSKSKREEAKITAWENLQKAKAEAAIRKLEMKLEKKRSSSMDKILNKLRSAQRKAQEMRNAVNASQANQVARTTRRISYFRRSGQIGSLSGCFTCHAF
ncbi:putative remorin [Dioscorea sansibarensis]